MPDVVVVGGGIIGAACARELARAGRSVTLLEKDELAAGASGRNLGYLDTSKDPVLAPLARASLADYLATVEESTVSVFCDREAIGTLAVTLEEDERDELRAWVETARAVGVEVEPVGDGALRTLEPDLSPRVVDAWLLHEGHRIDPGGLTVALAADARAHGADIRHHLPARRLIHRGERVTGVVTDDGPVEADLTVLAAGPWSAALVRPLGVRLPVAGARGWLVHATPDRSLIRHWIQSGARRLLSDREAVRASEPSPLAVSMREFGDGSETTDVGPMVQPAPDGSIVTGSSREPALAADAYGLDVARAVAREAARLIPSLSSAPVVATWSGVRPVSPDERPLIGSLCDGLLAATGHGSEGVILGGGTAQLVRAIVNGEEPPFDPAPFDPHRFEGRDAGWTTASS
ncbi:MAG: NAD(P)/FAD-dependent oxidoreductase [Actinomycetota bacterium]